MYYIIFVHISNCKTNLLVEISEIISKRIKLIIIAILGLSIIKARVIWKPFKITNNPSNILPTNYPTKNPINNPTKNPTITQTKNHSKSPIIQQKIQQKTQPKIQQWYQHYPLPIVLLQYHQIIPEIIPVIPTNNPRNIPTSTPINV